MKWPEVSPKRLLTALCVCGWILIIIVIIVVIVIFVIRDEPRPTGKNLHLCSTVKLYTLQTSFSS